MFQVVPDTGYELREGQLYLVPNVCKGLGEADQIGLYCTPLTVGVAVFARFLERKEYHLALFDVRSGRLVFLQREIIIMQGWKAYTDVGSFHRLRLKCRCFYRSFTACQRSLMVARVHSAGQHLRADGHCSRQASLVAESDSTACAELEISFVVRIPRPPLLMWKSVTQPPATGNLRWIMAWSEDIKSTRSSNACKKKRNDR